MKRSYWLLKSEPDVWSFTQQQQQGVETWDGVRNYQARNYLKAMNIGDWCFFYHSQSQRQIVGIVEVVSDYRPDPHDESGVFGLRDMRYQQWLPQPVTLTAVKSNPLLNGMALVRQSRLSVQPVTPEEWDYIMAMSQR